MANDNETPPTESLGELWNQVGKNIARALEGSLQNFAEALGQASEELKASLDKSKEEATPSEDAAASDSSSDAASSDAAEGSPEAKEKEGPKSDWAALAQEFGQLLQSGIQKISQESEAAISQLTSPETSQGLSELTRDILKRFQSALVDGEDIEATKRRNKLYVLKEEGKDAASTEGTVDKGEEE